MNANIPTLLLPLKIETRFVDNQLWIRVFPDEVFLEQHNPVLNARELQDALAFKELISNKELNSSENKKKTWQQLVAQYGAYRAAWVVHIERQELTRQIKMSENKVENRTFYFKWLPDVLHFQLSYNKGVKVTKIGNIIPANGLALMSNIGDASDEWVQNFDKAIEFGMGIKINLKDLIGFDPKVMTIDRIIVTGFRQNSTQNEVAALFKNHQYAKGFSFVEYGTPTNNFEDDRSGYSANDKYEAEQSYFYTVENFVDSNIGGKPPIGNLGVGGLVGASSGSGKEKAQKKAPTPAGYDLARALGLNTDEFKHIKNASYSLASFTDAYQQATWFAMGGLTLKMLFGDKLGSETHELLWEHYSRHVKAKGTLPAIKIGNQPYGILPVMSFNAETIASLDPFAVKLYPILKKLFNKWKGMVEGNPNIPKVSDKSEGDQYANIHKILSMQEYSTAYQLRVRKYDKISTRIPGWLQKEKNIPTPLPTLPLGQLGELLKDRGEMNSLTNPTPATRAKLDFLNGVISDQDKLLRAYILGFHDKPDTGENTTFFVKDNAETTVKDEIKLLVTQGDMAAFKQFIKDIKTVGTHVTAKKAPPQLSYGFSQTEYEELSVFIDFFLTGYAHAAQLYYQVVTFKPSIEELKAYKSFKIRTIDRTNNKIVLTDGLNVKDLVVNPPFAGSIEEWYVTEKDTLPLQVGQSLYLIKDEVKFKVINDIFVDIGEQIIAKLEGNLDKSKEFQKQALREAIDLNSYRLDAWMTSLADRTLNAQRSGVNSNGIYLGAYGWVENLKKDTENPVGAAMTDENSRSDGGIIHAPTPSQSLVATVFKNSFLTYKNAEGSDAPNPFTLNLFSDRIQKGRNFMEGVRQDQQVEALLGYHLERYLHDNNLHTSIYDLRAKYPLEVNIINNNNGTDVGFTKLSVIDGLKIIKAKESYTGVIKEGIAQLEDILDGSLDGLFFEAGYQLLNGNLERSAAAMDATMGKIAPPEIESLKTRLPGVGINHKLVLVFNEAPPPSRSYAKADAEPVLENWLATQLGSMDKIGCLVNYNAVPPPTSPSGGKPPVTIYQVAVKLSDLDISYLDFLYLSESQIQDGSSPLESRIWNYVKKQSTEQFDWANFTFKITPPPDGSKSLLEALEWAKYTLSFLSRCRYLKSEDLKTGVNESGVTYPDLDFVYNRLIKFTESGKLEGNLDLKYLAQFNFEYVQNIYLTSGKSNWSVFKEEALKAANAATLEATKAKIQAIEAALKKEITEKKATTQGYLDKYKEVTSFYQKFDCLEQAAKTLFGHAFILLPPAKTTQALPKQELLLGTDSAKAQERIQTWVEELAQVKQGAASFEEWLMVNTAWNNSQPTYDYKIMQSPAIDDKGVEFISPWVGLSKAEMDIVRPQGNVSLKGNVPSKGNAPYAYYPQGSESLVLFAPSTSASSQNTYGLVIEEFAEHIPDPEITTGLSFHYNAPNAEAPQALLLAVKNQNPKDTTPWAINDLLNIVNDTLDLAKIRLIDLEALKDLGFVLPMVNWVDIPPAN